MTPWIRRTVLGIAGAALALGTLTACGHRPDHHGWSSMSAEEQAKMRDKVLERVASRLELDAAQKQKLAVLADRLQEQRAALRGATDPHAEVRSLVAGERFDRSKAQALLAQKTAAVSTGSPAVIAALGDFYDSLNPQQQAQVREFMDRRRGWRHG